MFSQLSSHDSGNVAFLVCPRLFNDGERVGDAPEPLERLGPQDRDATRVRRDRYDDVLLDLDMNGRSLSGSHLIEQPQAALSVPCKKRFHRLHPNGIDIATSGRARAHRTGTE